MSSTLKREGAKPRGASDETEVTIDGKHLRLSRLNKVLYPKAGFTKGQVIDYYIRIAPVLLPHLRDRLLTLKRYPDGVEGGFFYEKRCPPYRPDWLQTAPMWSEGNNAEIHFCVAANLASLVWAANLADLELHTYLCRTADVDHPTMMVFDLDPGPPATILQCIEVGFLLKQALEAQQLESFPKTSGSKGLQIYVPLNTPVTYEQTKGFARDMAEAMVRLRPELIVSKMMKSLRGGKVLIDWSQNDRHKTTVCVYSLRAKDQPTVSTPVTWNELRSALKKGAAERLSFLTEDVLKRVQKHGDLFEPVLNLKQKLPKNVEPVALKAAQAAERRRS
jgi:bifunctional non-homologous end joining protein LigD